MGSYRIEFKPGVEKDLQKLPTRVVVRVVKRIESLAASPLPPSQQAGFGIRGSGFAEEDWVRGSVLRTPNPESRTPLAWSSHL